MSKQQSKQRRSVSLVALPESTPAVLYGLYEVFAGVGTAWEEITGQPTGVGTIDVRLVAPTREPFTCMMDVPIAPHAAFADIDRCDIVIIADLAVGLDEDPRGKWPQVAAWVREQHDKGALICTVCTGAVLLADTGLLDGCEATTHWSVADTMRRHYPAVTLRDERILVPAGEGHRIITGGGASSWEDLSLYLVARFAGQDEAVRIAKLFLFGDRSEGQACYAAAILPRRHEDAAIAEAQTWIGGHYAAAAPVARMAERSGLPLRTFKRRFKQATGYTPVDYVQTLRIEEAKQMLETTGEATDAVAHMVGYEDPAFFRRLFKRRTGVTQARYRQRYRFIGAADAARHSRQAGRGIHG